MVGIKFTSENSNHFYRNHSSPVSVDGAAVVVLGQSADLASLSESATTMTTSTIHQSGEVYLRVRVCVVSLFIIGVFFLGMNDIFMIDPTSQPLSTFIVCDLP